jgi:outer membrane protein
MQTKFLLSGLMLVSSLAMASDFKLGYVDVAKVFTTSKPAVAMQATLKAKFAPEQQELQKLNDEIVKQQAAIQAIMKKAPSMDKLSSADKASLETMGAKYQKDQASFQQKYMMFQQSSKQIQDYASALVLGKANTILKDISDKGNYDLVLTSNQLAFAKPKYDVTDQVIEQLNKVDTALLIKQLNDAEKQAAAGAVAAAGHSAASGATAGQQPAVTAPVK